MKIVGLMVCFATSILIYTENNVIGAAGWFLLSLNYVREIIEEKLNEPN